MNDEILDRIWKLTNRVDNEAKKSGNYYFTWNKSAAEVRFILAEAFPSGHGQHDRIDITFPIDALTLDVLKTVEIQLIKLARQLKSGSIAELGSILTEFSK